MRSKCRVFADVSKLGVAVIGVVAAVGVLALARAQPTESARPPALLTYAAVFANQLSSSSPGAICVARADGSRRQRLLRRKGVSQPAWSPRGRFVAFTQAVRHHTPSADVYWEVMVANARGLSIRNFSNGYATLNYDPSWSPDGKQVAFAAGWHGGFIVIADADGSNQRPLAATSSGVYTLLPSSPSWSPDGRRILYTKIPAGLTVPDVHVIDADGNNPRLVASNAEQPAYSPDGSRFAYVAEPQYAGSGGNIVVANADGSDPHVITRLHADLHPAWSPDGTRLAFNRLKNGRYTIVVAKTDGSHARTVVSSHTYQALDPTWRPPTALPSMKRPTCRR